MNNKLATPKHEARARKVISALQNWNDRLFPKEREAKYCKMASAPLVFYRGTDHLFWADFANDERLSQFGNAETRTWLQGDLHVYNYGSFDNAKGEVVYDLNDFDETIYADYQYDLWRMAVSIVLVARQNNDLSASQLEKVVDVFSHTYVDTLNSYRKKNDAKKIYFTKQNTYGNLDRFLKSVGQEYSRKGMLDRWAPKDKKGRRRFDVKGRPDKLDKATDEQCKVIREAMAAYRNSLDNDLAKNDTYFKVKDIARRLGAGTGSLGTSRFYVLIEAGKPGNLDDDRILDVKQQSRPTPYDFLDKESKFEYDKVYEDNHARRHAVAYQALTYRTDPHLGWMYLEPLEVQVSKDVRECSGYYSVRERSPFKEAFPGEALDTRTAFSVMAEQWAEVLATDHACANKALPGLVHALTDDHETAFLDVVREIAFSYADQVQVDWECFNTALKLKPGECDKLAFVPPSYRDMLPR